ncbi:hypothetical protein [uncultured Bacteroides sp.]|uniref:hypothetical protein n=1 Tax=uncultured Bacteroides sp. TaxID=162156 RepID=UPI0025E5C80E|nr:hypothetical protein [uncultured Bacteroides sp.]
MAKNSYLYREPDYDGLVLFYAINGSFINGWRYSDGKIVGYLSPSCDTQAESFVSTCGMQPVCHDICTTEYSYNCHDEYVLVGGDMETGLIYDIVTYCDLVPYKRCYRECEFVGDGKVDPNNPYPPNTIGYGGTESLKGAMEILMNSILNKGGFSKEQLPLYREVANNWYQYSGTYTESFPPKVLYQYIKK